MVLIDAPCFWLLTDHELRRLRQSGNAMLGLLLRKESFNAVIKSRVRQSKIFDSSFDPFFDEACLCITCKKLLFFEFLQAAGQALYRRYAGVMRLL